VTDWKTDRNPLVDNGMAFAEAVPGEASAQDLADRPRLEPMNWGAPQREEITQRVSNFKAQQQRLIKRARSLRHLNFEEDEAKSNSIGSMFSLDVGGATNHFPPSGDALPGRSDRILDAGFG
jgi:hypothetical protein